MRRFFVLAVAALALAGLAGCSEVENAVRDQIRSACDRAVTAAEESATDGTGAAALVDALSGRIDEQYRGFMDQVVDQIPAEAAERGIADGVEQAVPAEQRAEWHDMAVDVCTDQVASQVSLG